VRWAVCLSLVLGCSERAAEDYSDWFDAGSAYDVMEPVEFTDVPYDFPASETDGIAAQSAQVFPVADSYAVSFAPEDAYASNIDCDQVTDSDLPFTVTGMVTAHPRVYFKTDGCNRDDEKYYGSYFIEDRTGGMFVLGDSKVAHFGMGDKVTLAIRAVRTSFDLNMVVVHDVLSVERGPDPIAFEVANAEFTLDDIARVKRVTGTVLTDPDTFGSFRIEDDDGNQYLVALDAEVSRRGVHYEVGSRIQATGPVMYSYSEFTIVVMRVGQIETLSNE
jgi:hypothetical protein